MPIDRIYGIHPNIHDWPYANNFDIDHKNLTHFVRLFHLNWVLAAWKSTHWITTGNTMGHKSSNSPVLFAHFECMKSYVVTVIRLIQNFASNFGSSFCEYAETFISQRISLYPMSKVWPRPPIKKSNACDKNAALLLHQIKKIFTRNRMFDSFTRLYSVKKKGMKTHAKLSLNLNRSI